MGACLTLSVMLAPIGMDKALHARRAQSGTSTAHSSQLTHSSSAAPRSAPSKTGTCVVSWPVVPLRSPFAPASQSFHAGSCPSCLVGDDEIRSRRCYERGPY